MTISQRDKNLVQASFAQVAPQADEVAACFYARLFEIDPALQSLFKPDLREQRRKLMQTLQVAVKGLDDLDGLVPVLQRLAVRHIGYGVRFEHYDTVGSALLWTLEQGLDEAFTQEVHSAWSKVYTVMSGVMMDATTVALAERAPVAAT